MPNKTETTATDHAQSFTESFMPLSDPVQVYEENIRRANIRATKLYQTYVSNQQRVYSTTIFLEYVFIAISALAIIGSVAIAFWGAGTNPYLQTFTVFLLLSGVLLGIIMVTRHPFQMLKTQMREIIKINMIYAGFSRQIYQIDAEYRKIISQSEVNSAEMRALSKQVLAAMEQTINMFSMTIDEIEE